MILIKIKKKWKEDKVKKIKANNTEAGNKNKNSPRKKSKL